MSELSHNSPGRVSHCEARRDAGITEKIERLKEEIARGADPEINVQLYYWSVLLNNIHKNPAIARASDW
eukprot:2509128-Prorocentrum_lima.AAC.1